MTGEGVAPAMAVDHPWATRSPVLWRAIDTVAAVLVMGSLLTIGIALPPILPLAIAGSARIAVRQARGRAVHPLGDALSGIREDLPGIAVVVLVVGMVVAPPVWLLGMTGPSDSDLEAGIRLGLITVTALGLGPLVIGSAVVAATTTQARSAPAVSFALALRSRARSLAIVGVMTLGLAPLATSSVPTVLPIWIGTAYLLATRLAMDTLRANGSDDGTN